MINKRSLSSFCESSLDNVPPTVTTLAPALPQPSLPAQAVDPSMEVTPEKGYLTNRGYSDSAVPGCRATVANGNDSHNVDSPSQNGMADPVIANGIWSTTQAVHVKSRPQFQLPCFKSLGISSRLPDAPLTPPDESVVDLITTAPSFISRSSSYPPANMPKTPSPERSDIAAILGNLSITEGSSSTQPTVAATAPQDSIEQEGTGPTSSSSEDEELDPAHAGWIVDAVEAAG